MSVQDFLLSVECVEGERVDDTDLAEVLPSTLNFGILTPVVKAVTVTEMQAPSDGLLVYVDRRYNSVKMGDRWFWEILDQNGKKVRVNRTGRRYVETFGWARSERQAYRLARRAKWVVRTELKLWRGEVVHGKPLPPGKSCH